MISTNEKINKMKKSLLFIFLMAIGIAVFAQAQTYNFTNGGQDNLWNNPDNWDQGSVPSTSDHNVRIDGATYNVEVQADASCGYLELINGSSLVVRNNATLTVSYPPIPDGLNVQLLTGTTLTIDNGGTLEYDGQFRVVGNLIVNGTVDLVPPPAK